jgi:hypothetical protein
VKGLYRLASDLDHPANRADLEGSQARAIDFLVYGKGDGKFLRFVSLRAKAQEGYTIASLAATDFVAGSGSVPLFSDRFRQEVGATLDDEVKFYECRVECQGREFSFHAGQTTRSRDLIDSAGSSYHTLTDGSKIVERAAYRSDCPQDFFLAREKSEPSRLIASDRFRDLVTSLGLHVRLLAPI